MFMPATVLVVGTGGLGHSQKMLSGGTESQALHAGVAG